MDETDRNTPDGEILPAGPQHAAALALIHAASFPPAERWGADAMALQLGLHGGFGLIDPRGAMLLARTVADEAEILTLAVIPACRRQGLGAALLRRATRLAAQRGATALFLEVSVANAPARALYRANGFVEVGRRRAYYSDATDALILKRSPIGPDPAAAADG